MITLVAAVADNGVIGRDNALPWRLPSDLRHFKALTWGHPVIMGRRTFESLGKPLAGRTNIVVSATPDYCAAQAVAVSDLPSALDVAHADLLRRNGCEIFIIGGAVLYRQMLPLARRIVLTRVHLSPEGDSVFPVMDMNAWECVSSQPLPAHPKDDASADILIYQRKSAP